MKSKIAKTTALIAGASLMLGASAVFAIDGDANTTQQAAQSASGSNMKATDPAMFVDAANNINLTGIEAGRLAKERGQSEGVKKLGARMIRDHTALEKKLKTLASSENINVPDALDPVHQKQVDDLAALSGSEFDKQYTEAMVKGHQKAIAFFQEASAENTDPKVREFATKALPELQHHLQLAEKNASIVDEPAGAGQ